MSVKKLLWEKWRPKSLEDIILLPRIKKRFLNGVDQHYIFYGSQGSGKTSLARILIGKYNPGESAFLEVNCSDETSVDFLREEIASFCKTRPMFETNSDIKYVFLDEFDRVSASFEDAFKAFIEKYNNKVRFILCTNYISKIDEKLKSRFKSINFDCINIEEERYLKKEFFLRIKDKIMPSENINLTKEELVGIVTKTFPDFRNTIVELQDLADYGGDGIMTGNVSNKVKLELYDIIFGEYDYEKIWNFLVNSFGPEKINNMIDVLGRPFVKWVMENKLDCSDKLFKANYVITDYGNKMDESDPIILGMTIIGKLRDIFINRDL